MLYQKIDVSEAIKNKCIKEMWALSLLVFKDIGFKFEENVHNKCLDLLTIAYHLKDIAILNAKGNTYRCILMCISKNKGLKRLNNSVTYDKGVL